MPRDSAIGKLVQHREFPTQPPPPLFMRKLLTTKCRRMSAHEAETSLGSGQGRPQAPFCWKKRTVKSVSCGWALIKHLVVALGPD